MTVFLTGSTGYMGQRLIPLLLERGHRVRALVRAGSEKKLPAGCESVVGDALDAGTYAAAVPPADTFVHLAAYPNRIRGRVHSFGRSTCPQSVPQ